ncbi:MAG: transcription termination factor Rho [Armatimonadetes bacterium]|nr:transcription termination factor Rho [Armatimonadota bacterium]
MTAQAETVEGVLEILASGAGFVRTREDLNPSPKDPYVAPSQIRACGLRTGDRIAGRVRPPSGRERSPSLVVVESIEGEPPDSARERPFFDGLTAISPEERLRLESGPADLTGRAIDLLAPLGKGQRGLIVAPPKAGKTRIIQEIARSVARTTPDAVLLLLLIDERPEEVTDFRREGAGQVYASSFDAESRDHLHLARLVQARAERLVERGRDVVILLDSLTRLARAANLGERGTGRSLSGGLDAAALRMPRQFLGDARKIEGGGSLTILATVLVETGSRLDDVIFEEFKGTGNWEIRLNRRIAERRLYPAIDVAATGTRREELLVPDDELEAMNRLRRHLLDHDTQPEGRAERLLELLRETASNAELLARVTRLIRA